MPLTKKLYNSMFKKLDDTSGAFQLDVTDLIKLVRTAAIVGGASAIAYLLDNTGTINFGSYGVFLIPVLTTILTAIQRFLKDAT